MGIPAPTPVGLDVAGPDEDPGQPRLEPIGVAKRREVAPGVDEGDLDRVLGSIEIAQDPIRNRDESIAGDGHQAGVRVLVTFDRQLDECSIHCRRRSLVRPGRDATPLMGARLIRSVRSPTADRSSSSSGAGSLGASSAERRHRPRVHRRHRVALERRRQPRPEEPRPRDRPVAVPAPDRVGGLDRRRRRRGSSAPNRASCSRSPRPLAVTPEQPDPEPADLRPGELEGRPADRLGQVGRLGAASAAG